MIYENRSMTEQFLKCSFASSSSSFFFSFPTIKTPQLCRTYEGRILNSCSFLGKRIARRQRVIYFPVASDVMIVYPRPLMFLHVRASEGVDWWRYYGNLTVHSNTPLMKAIYSILCVRIIDFDISILLMLTIYSAQVNAVKVLWMV